MMRQYGMLLLVGLLMLVGVGAISAQEQEDEADLSISVLPVLNTMPFFVAEQEGFYEDEGVSVDLVPFDSARDRQIALQTGQIDGANTDMVGVILLAAAGSEIKIVRHDAPITPAFFAIVAGAESGITTLEELVAALQSDDAQIAISNNTIIEYLTTAMLRSAGYEPVPNNYLEISAIPVRLEQLAAGTVPAAMLPEPLTTLASTLQGGTVIVDDSAIDFVPTVIAFRQEVIDERPEAIAAFLRAYERAVNAIAEDPEAYRDVRIQVPDPVRATYEIPQIVPARVPNEDEVQAVQDWMIERGLLDEALPYETVVDGAYLPEMPDDEMQESDEADDDAEQDANDDAEPVATEEADS